MNEVQHVILAYQKSQFAKKVYIADQTPEVPELQQVFRKAINLHIDIAQDIAHQLLISLNNTDQMPDLETVHITRDHVHLVLAGIVQVPAQFPEHHLRELCKEYNFILEGIAQRAMKESALQLGKES